MSRIIGVGKYLPTNQVTNQQLIDEYQLDSSDEWIQQRTGIKSRNFANPQQSLEDLANLAVKNLLEDFGPEQSNEILQNLNLIVAATMSNKETTPSLANRVQRHFQVQNAISFDISAACSGFVYALEIANSLSRDYQTGYTLVIGAEKMSQILDFSDRGTAILFGDGAGCVLIKNDGQGLINYQSQLYALGDDEDSITVAPNDHGQILMAMKGRQVFNFVQRRVIPSIEEFIEENSLVSIDYLLLHQANDRFAQMIAKKLDFDLEKIPRNIFNHGNLSAASIPVLLKECIENKLISFNGQQVIMMTGFGAGLTWGNISLTI